MSQVPDPFLDPAAVLWSSRPAELAERPLLVLLHGVGSHEGDLFSLSPRLPLHPVIASLRAPTRHGQGWSWFDLGTPGNPNLGGVDAAARGVLGWLDALPLQPPSIGLLGFSQGAAVAMQALRHAPARFSYGVLLSGFIAPGTAPGDDELARRRPPVFWGRGTADAMIPNAAVERTAEWLESHTTLEAHIYEGLAHAVSPVELADLTAFLAARLR